MSALHEGEWHQAVPRQPDRGITASLPSDRVDPAGAKTNKTGVRERSVGGVVGGQPGREQLQSMPSVTQMRPSERPDAVPGPQDERVETGEMLSFEYEGPGTLGELVGRKTPIDALVATRYQPDLVAARAGAELVKEDARPVKVVDFTGFSADKAIDEARMAGKSVRVVPVSARQGGLLDELPTGTRARVLAHSGVYQNPGDEAYATETMEEAARVAENEIVVRTARPDNLSATKILDAFRVARGTYDPEKGSLHVRTQRAIDDAEIVAEPDRTAEAHALMAAENNARRFIAESRQEGGVDNNNGRQADLTVYRHTPTGNVSKDGVRLQMLAVAMPDLVVPGDHVIAAGIERIDDPTLFTQLRTLPGAQGATVDLIADPATLGDTSVMGADPTVPLYVGNSPDGGVSNAVAEKFGEHDVSQVTGVTIHGTRTEGGGEGTSRSLSSGGGSSKTNGGERNLNTSRGFDVTVNIGRATERVLRGEHVRALEPHQGFVRGPGSEDFVYPVTLQSGQEPPTIRQPQVVDPAHQRFLDETESAVKSRPDALPLTAHAERAGVLEEEVPKPGPGDIQPHGADTHLHAHHSQSRERQLLPNGQVLNERDLSFHEWLTQTEDGQTELRGYVGQMWLERPEGKKFSKSREGRVWMAEEAARKEADAARRAQLLPAPRELTQYEEPGNGAATQPDYYASGRIPQENDEPATIDDDFSPYRKDAPPPASTPTEPVAVAPPQRFLGRYLREPGSTRGERAREQAVRNWSGLPERTADLLPAQVAAIASETAADSVVVRTGVPAGLQVTYAAERRTPGGGTQTFGDGSQGNPSELPAFFNERVGRSNAIYTENARGSMELVRDLVEGYTFTDGQARLYRGPDGIVQPGARLTVVYNPYLANDQAVQRRFEYPRPDNRPGNLLIASGTIPTDLRTFLEEEMAVNPKLARQHLRQIASEWVHRNGGVPRGGVNMPPVDIAGGPKLKFYEIKTHIDADGMLRFAYPKL